MAMTKRLLDLKHLVSLSTRRGLSQDGSAMIQTPIPLFGIEGRYASALYSAASKKKQLDVVDSDLAKIAELLKKDKPFREMLSNPLFNVSDKKNIITSALSSKLKVCDLTINLIKVMTDNGRLKFLPRVTNSFNRVMAISRGEVEVTVTTAKPMDEALKKEVEESLKGFCKGKKLTITVAINPDIIGGMIVDFSGEHYIDMSIRKKINMYSELVKQAV